jgi:peptidoglycan/LPS O-acetylase OafA/YrhL
MTKNIPALTSIRGVAALSVMLYHISLTYKDLSLFSPFKHADLGVDLFFVLSGFILTYVYESEISTNLKFKLFYVTFLKARIARIYPLQIVTLGFTLMLVLMLPDFSGRYHDYFTGLSFFYNLLLIQNWGMIGVSWNMVSWSISAEFFMYLLFPFLLILFKKLKKPAHILTLSFLIFGLHNCFIYLSNLDNYGGMSLGGMFRVFFEFTLGMTLFLSREFVKNIFDQLSSRLCEILVILSLASVYFKSIWFFFVPSISLLIVHLSLLDSKTSQFLSRRVMVYLGEISFSLYMWHWLVIQINNWLLYKHVFTTNSIEAKYLACAVIIFLCLLIAHYSYYYIEIPARRWIRSTFR